MASAKITSKKEGDVLFVTISGYVGENAGLFDLNFFGVTKMIVDVSGVNYMNSVGVKYWIIWTGKFPKTLQIEFHKCPSMIVNQVNMVAGFLPNSGTIESLTAPFACSSCNREESYLLTRGIEYQYATATESYQFNPGDKKCPKCGKPMELDAIEGKFFHFLRSPR